MEHLNSGSMLDLKTIFGSRKYTRRILNSLGKNGETFLIDDAIFQAVELRQDSCLSGMNFGEGIAKTNDYKRYLPRSYANAE